MSEPPGDGADVGIAIPIAVGSRVRLSGGYFVDVEWLHDRVFIDGTVERFVSDDKVTPMAVVRLDEPLAFAGGEGQWAVLSLRHVGAMWVDDAVVHVELYVSSPDELPSLERRREAWVEAAATCRLVTS